MQIQDLSPRPVTLANGMVVNYVRQGDGIPVIFVHGAMGDWRSFAPQWAAFVPHFDCISYSRRYSYPNPNEMNSRSHNALVDAEDLIGLMDALEIERAILVGSSYGGFTALAAAVAAPDRVLAVVSVEAPMMRYAKMTPEGAAIADAFLEKAALPAQRAFERGENELGVRLLTGGIVGKRPEDIPAKIMERRLQNMHAARSLSLSEDEFPLLEPEALGALKMPVFLFSGANTAPVHAEIFKSVTAAMPQARSMIVEGSGHSVAQQQADVFNSQVLQFLESNALLERRETV